MIQSTVISFFLLRSVLLRFSWCFHWCHCGRPPLPLLSRELSRTSDWRLQCINTGALGPPWGRRALREESGTCCGSGTTPQAQKAGVSSTFWVPLPLPAPPTSRLCLSLLEREKDQQGPFLQPCTTFLRLRKSKGDLSSQQMPQNIYKGVKGCHPLYYRTLKFGLIYGFQATEH